MPTIPTNLPGAGLPPMGPPPGGPATMPPPPGPPMGLGGPPMPTGPGGPVPGISPEEMAAAVQRDFANLEFRNDKLESKMLADKDKIAKTKQDLLDDIYAAMEKLGIDPDDPESFVAIVNVLNREDPDLAAIFEAAFTGLKDFGDQEELATPEMEPPLPDPDMVEAGLPGPPPEDMPGLPQEGMPELPPEGLGEPQEPPNIVPIEEGL